MQVKIDPILMVLSVSETLYPTYSADISSDLYRNFPVLAKINTTTLPAGPSSSSSPPSHTLSAAIISLPSLLLESAKSHVLDEPVPRQLKADTLPWDCSLTDMAIFTASGPHVRHMLEPVGMKVTFAAQQEGIGVTVDADTVALSVSKKQVC